MDKHLKEAEELATTLIGIAPRPFSSTNDFPVTGGVYLIYDKQGRITYIGKARNLRRRICNDHMSAEASDTMSSFRRSVNARHSISYGPDMRSYILANCSFAFLEIEDPDMRGLLEALLIRHFRNADLLNKS